MGGDIAFVSGQNGVGHIRESNVSPYVSIVVDENYVVEENGSVIHRRYLDC